MIHALTLLLGCQLAGELGVRAAGLPVPGPVLGLVLLFLALAVRRAVWPDLGHVAHGLLAHLSLLFVPAGVGVMRQADVLAANWLALGAALVAGTALTIVVAAATFVATARLTGGSSGDGTGPA